ncbi:MAG TPA: bifunctional riboflavin kinase/FAD synthetase [Casimicrobiaceae bacterium]|nr:bifunctional riboflavin kinase/FAD synthetase [Casimicrobiaceae bacterium]
MHPAAAAGRPVALTIGNFDGVHRGHQAMLARLMEAAEDLQLVPAVLTFDPHPREFFAPAAAPPRLSTLRAKLEALRAYGVADAYVARFDQRLASLEPEAFIEQVLVQGLGVRWVLVGDDFRFGRARRGDLALLRHHARTFSVEGMSTVRVSGERVSSTAVREALARGELAHAAALLGRPYTLSGRVAHGDKLGRDLGFPTANVPLRHKPALQGIFAVRVHGLQGSPLRGVASLGVRPTVKRDAAPLLEAFLFDFDASIYGRRITVEFLHKLRDEARYPDVDALTRQIQRDVAQAREYFAAAS